MRITRLFLSAGLLFLFGCGQKNLPETMPAEDLHDLARKELEDGDTQKAIELFQRVTYEFPGSEYVEDARLGLAEAYFQGEDYLLAANEFERFSNEFSLSHEAARALYRAAYSHEKISESFPLDQTETVKAVDLYEQVDRRFPHSAYADSAVVRSYFLKDRLARKAFENGYFYYKRKFYDSAIIYFETMIEEFGQSSWLAPAYYYLARAYDVLKLPEEARLARLRLLEQFPLTTEAEQVRQEHPELITGNESPGPVTEKGGEG
jgi:outer membrane protein assembly factor BamD